MFLFSPSKCLALKKSYYVLHHLCEMVNDNSQITGVWAIYIFGIDSKNYNCWQIKFYFDLGCLRRSNVTAIYF